MVIAPGLHFLGPDDPRMQRLAMVLASAGALVLSPSIPAYRDLVLRPEAAMDFQDAVAFLLADPRLDQGRPVGLMSVSFGSWLALEAAASPLGDRVGGVMLYGGFCDWRETMGFCLEGAHGVEPPRLHDPLNRPVIYLNVLDTLPGRPEDTSALAEAWRAFVVATWGQEVYKREGRHLEVARAMAARLEPSLRDLFLEGCGVEGVSDDRVHQALEASGGRPWLDTRPRLHQIRCPVAMIHGVDDDVIPVEQMDKLTAAFPAGHPVTAFRTGWLSHAGRAGLGQVLGAIPMAIRELMTMGAMLRSLGDTAGLEGP